MPRWLEHRIPPPLIDLACAALMWVLARWLPQAQWWPRGASWLVWLVAIALALAGGLIALAGVHEFKRARTTINPLAPQRASALVQTGVFGLTRNPMYLGMLMLLMGCAAYLGNAVSLLVLPLFVWLLNTLQIKPEERILQDRFGEHFTRYAARVRRWV